MSGNGKGTSVAGGAAVGSAAGVLIAELLKGKPAAAASDAAKLDYIASLLEKILAALLGGGGGFPASFLTPWVATEKQNLLDMAIRSVGVFDSDFRVDLTRSKRLLVKVESSLDQPVTIQLYGNTDDTPLLAANIDGPVVILANGNASIGLDWDDWHPYVGVRITTAVAPTIGILNIWSVRQE